MDFDIRLAAVANDAQAIEYLDEEVEDHDMLAFAKAVRDKLELYYGYTSGFLCAVDILGGRRKRRDTNGDGEEATETEETNMEQCELPILSMGNETGTALKRLIAEYAGVPRGKELEELQMASTNLTMMGY
jgi:hypothetical protein